MSAHVRNDPGARPGLNLKVPCLTSLDHEHLGELIAAETFFWLDLTDPSDEQIDRLGELFGLHHLALEASKELGQRPKLDEYDGHGFLVFYGAAESTPPGEPFLAEVHMFVAGSHIITLHRDPLPQFDALRARVADQTVRSEQYLLYRILDELTDTFFPVLDDIDDRIDTLEDEVIVHPSDDHLQTIFSLKRDLVALRRVITPQRDIFARSIDRIGELLTTDEPEYFRSIYDHLIRVSDLVDSYRDLLSGAADMHLSVIANRQAETSVHQGEVGKQLAIIATIFLPLTFLTGFFGQNFSFLVDDVLKGTWAFVGVGLGSLAISCLGFWLFFRRKGWL